MYLFKSKPSPNLASGIPPAQHFVDIPVGYRLGMFFNQPLTLNISCWWTKTGIGDGSALFSWIWDATSVRETETRANDKDPVSRCWSNHAENTQLDILQSGVADPHLTGGHRQGQVTWLCMAQQNISASSYRKELCVRRHPKLKLSYTTGQELTQNSWESFLFYCIRYN